MGWRVWVRAVVIRGSGDVVPTRPLRNADLARRSRSRFSGLAPDARRAGLSGDNRAGPPAGAPVLAALGPAGRSAWRIALEPEQAARARGRAGRSSDHSRPGER